MMSSNTALMYVEQSTSSDTLVDYGGVRSVMTSCTVAPSLATVSVASDSVRSTVSTTECSSSSTIVPPVLVSKEKESLDSNFCSLLNDLSIGTNTNANVTTTSHRYTIEAMLGLNTQVQMADDYNTRTERILQHLKPHYLNIGNPFPPSTYVTRTPLSPINVFGTPKQTMGLPTFYSPGLRPATINNIRPSPLHPCSPTPLRNTPLPLQLSPLLNSSSPTNHPIKHIPYPLHKKNVTSPPPQRPTSPVNHPPAQMSTSKHTSPLTSPPAKQPYALKMKISSPKSPSQSVTSSHIVGGSLPPAAAAAPAFVPSAVADSKKCTSLTYGDSCVQTTIATPAQKLAPRRSPTGNKENKVSSTLPLSPLAMKENNVNNKTNKSINNSITNTLTTPNNKQHPLQQHSNNKPQGTLSPFKAKLQNQVASSVVKAVVETPVKVKSQPQPSVPVTPVQTPLVIRSVDNTADGGTPVVSPTKSSPSSPSKCETDPHRLQQRQKQVDYGYRTLGYIRYRLNVLIESRDLEQPKTPRKVQCCSKRSWDGQVKKWRRDLHKWDPTDPVEFETLTDPKVLATIFSNPNEIPLVLKQLEEQIIELKQTGTLKPTTGEEEEEYLLDSKPTSPNATAKELLQLLRSDDDIHTNDIELKKSDTSDDFVGEEDTTIQTKPSTVRMLVF